MFSFLCCDKGNEKSRVVWSSESPSRGYWKQFFLSRPSEYSQYLPAVEGDTFTQAPMSHPTVQPRGHSGPGYSVPSNNRAKGDTLTQAPVSHQSDAHSYQGSNVPPGYGVHSYPGSIVPPNSPTKGTLWPRLQCPTQQSSQGGHSDPGYSVPPNSPAKEDTYPGSSVPPNSPAKVDALT